MNLYITKSWKNIQHKNKLLMILYTSNIFWFSLWDGNYYPKVFLEKLIRKFFWRRMTNFGFWGFESFSLNIRSFLNPELETSEESVLFVFRAWKVASWNIRSFLGFSLPSSNIKNFFRVSIFGNKRKSFYWENIRHFLILEYKKLSRKIFLLLELGLKSSISRNIRSFFRVSFSWNIRNCFGKFPFP